MGIDIEQTRQYYEDIKIEDKQKFPFLSQTETSDFFLKRRFQAPAESQK